MNDKKHFLKINSTKKMKNSIIQYHNKRHKLCKTTQTNIK
jgi:hypothetical protein